MEAKFLAWENFFWKNQFLTVFITSQYLGFLECFFEEKNMDSFYFKPNFWLFRRNLVEQLFLTDSYYSSKILGFLGQNVWNMNFWLVYILSQIIRFGGFFFKSIFLIDNFYLKPNSWLFSEEFFSKNQFLT